ncbi:hypothetical protein C8R46DRAFT_1195056 [Mycena filopes]|nr:hypothetical protein C8R46DRAFT_1195056 [Mycena filopes]
MPASSVSLEIHSGLVVFASGPNYRPSTAFPSLDDPDSWDCANIAPEGSTVRKALRACHEISGKAVFEHAIVEMLIQSGALIGKPQGYSTTIQRAVADEGVLLGIFKKLDPKLLAHKVNVVTGLYQFVGAYIAQVKGDTGKLINWLRPIFQPVLAVADTIYLEFKLPEPEQADPRTKLRISAAHRFLLNIWEIQKEAEARGLAGGSPTTDSDTSSSSGGEAEKLDLNGAVVADEGFTIPAMSPMQFASSPELTNNTILGVDSDLHAFYNSPINRGQPGALHPSNWKRSALANGDRMLGQMFSGQATPQHLTLDSPMPGISPPSPKKHSAAAELMSPPAAGLTLTLDDLYSDFFPSDLLQAPFKYDEPKERRRTRTQSENFSPTGRSMASVAKGRSPLTPTNGRSPALAK